MVNIIHQKSENASNVNCQIYNSAGGGKLSERFTRKKSLLQRSGSREKTPRYDPMSDKGDSETGLVPNQESGKDSHHAVDSESEQSEPQRMKPIRKKTDSISEKQGNRISDRKKPAVMFHRDIQTLCIKQLLW